MGVVTHVGEVQVIGDSQELSIGWALALYTRPQKQWRWCGLQGNRSDGTCVSIGRMLAIDIHIWERWWWCKKQKEETVTTRAKAFPSHVGSRMGLPDIGVSMKCRRPDALEFTRAVSMLIFLGMVPNLWHKRVDTRGQTGRVLLSRQSWNRLCWSVSHISLHLSSTIKTCPWRHPLGFVPAIWMKVLSHNALSPVSIVCLFVCLMRMVNSWSFYGNV